MKKTALFLVLILVLSVFAFASCDKLGLGKKECTEHVDADGNYVCDNCEAELPKQDTPNDSEHTHSYVDGKCECGEKDPNYVPPCKHTDYDNNHKCDKCENVITICKDSNADHKCDVCEATLSEHNASEGSHTCTICGIALSEHNGSEGSHACTICGAIISECADENGDYACDTCGGDVIPDTHERLEAFLNIGDLEVGTLADDLIRGRFTISAGSEIRNRNKNYTDPVTGEKLDLPDSVKLGNDASTVTASVPGTGTLYVYVRNGSGSAQTQFIKVTAPDGTVTEIEFAGKSEGDPMVKIEIPVTKGDWKINRVSGTVDLHAIGLLCIVEKSDENGFAIVSEGTVDYLCGSELDFTNLSIQATFANGNTAPLTIDDVTIDSSAVDMTAAGTYPIVISYKEYTPITFYVNIYAPDSIELGFDAVEKISNSQAGNSVYYNYSWKELYLVGEELNTKGLSVIVVAKCGDKSLKFKVDDYEIAGFDSTDENIYTLTISAYGVDATVDIHVCATEPTPNEDGVYMLLVDPEYISIAGSLSGPYHVFRTIQAALDYAENIDKAAVKELYIAPGYYKEKLEITVPNLHIIGWGETPDEVVIEWDSLYGLQDASGFTHVTDSTQTVAVRDTATGVTIKNLTISNAFNSKDYFDKTLGENYSEHRALALLVMADRFIMEDCILLGYQDTLELFTGRQYIKNTEIHGYTDFIFGTNNTTFFENCVINTIYSGKSNGGYLTAFKGSNKGANDAITYGAIFYHCKFTADEGVSDGRTAIGRPWGAYAAVAVIECELGSHIATTATGTADQNERYVTMSGNKPIDETVQFVEYNNTGAGAITEAVAGMRFLTAEEAALYADFATIFGTINGKVTYLDPWNPESTEIIVDDRTYYYFNGVEGTSGTSYTYTENVQGTTLEWNGLLIDATAGKLTSRGSDAQFNQGAKIIFNVEAGTLVTVVSYPGYGNYTINGIAHNANDTFSVYFDEDAEVVIEATATSYIHQIIINPNEEAPAAPTLNEIKVEGLKVDYLVGEEFTLEGLVVNAVYSDHSLVQVSDYTVDSSAVDSTAAGEYNVVITVGDKSANVTVCYVGDPTIRESTTINLSATGAHIEGSVGTYKNLTVDATNGKFKDNNGGWTQVNTGTIISFAYAGEVEVSVTAYSSAGNFDIVMADGIYTITAVGNDYLSAISVKVKVVYSESTTIDLTATGANIQKTTGVYKGLEIDATNGKFADNNGGWTQVNTGTIIKLNVVDGATVSVTAHSSAENFNIVIADGVCTITAVGNDYLSAITVAY